MFSTFTVLPGNLQNINRVVNIQERVALHQGYALFSSLLREHKGLIIDDAVRRMVNRFFFYLDTSCESVERVNKRSKWLVRYFDLVNYRLLDVRSRYVVKHSVPDKIRGEWNELLLPLFDQLDAYVILHPKSCDVEKLAGYFNEIGDYLAFCPIDPTSDHYNKVTSTIVEFTETLQQFIFCHTENNHFNPLHYLMRLRFHCHYYALYQQWLTGQ